MALKGPRKTVLQLVGVVVLMGGLSWASVPFYDWFCRVTGFGGVTGVASTGSDTILDQTIKVRFDGSKERGMPWEFKPVQREMEVRLGETGLAFYEAYNPTDRPVAGQASYNVAPYQAGGFFSKIDCFCFTEQVLQPGERVQMPVTFYVDPEIIDDRDAKYVHTITLSYTFHEIDLPEGYAALDTGGNTGAGATTN
ncbi:cytochrome c oxidase assembly protein [Leisingera aquaemixtae]|uniref:Cytochrome c oxidase assembly protein CtaG n=1 Tax=Leisingera aquaemixtae TaxID=1396826 RepID=A0ABY5WG84_9RHOB|nr:cytochrome c oxidase assembly protein [Leisingera aquaemixtae]UWQ36374.1 cytochrome c oxidase assembly protein [Leisingera aquaemixtae]UWQ40484.1 cytochrome c oxidase assembly protein [Leisingera aquaemixtae]UWQ44738.1 cytochrome c oxidase assembly protein [Leisingera aquaemixtae]